MSSDMNEQLVLISGESATGKSASLMNLRDQSQVLYLNCESGKRLPFPNKFLSKTVTDPYQIYEGFDWAKGNSDIRVIVIDTLTFLMDMFESQYIIGSSNTMQGWANYAQYFKNLMQQYVASSDKQVIFLAHTRADLDEKAMDMKTSVPIKGSLKNNGIEAYFSTVVSTKKMPVKALEGKTDTNLLHVSEEEEALGLKYVFQTRLTKETVGERIRSPMKMWAPNQTYIDNDAQLLLDHLQEYYGT